MTRFDFSAWTVAQRELREGSRRWANYWLRTAGGVAGAALLWMTILQSEVPLGETGVYIFLRLHLLILALMAFVVPGMAADCIARERREGTLGLLFLTPLSDRGVVIGKTLTQALRVVTLWLAMLPILTIPFLTGGVAWNVAVQRGIIELCVMVMCLASGVMASACVKSRGGAFLLAYILAEAAFTAVAVMEETLQSPAAEQYYGGGPLENGFSIITGNTEVMQETAVAFASAAGAPEALRSASRLASQAGWGSREWEVMLSTFFLTSLLFLIAAISLGGAVINRSWRDYAPSARRQSLMRRYCAPLWRGYFTRRTGRRLERNPIAWLQEYSWQARLSKWGICGAFVLLDALLLIVFNKSGSSLVFDIQPYFAIFLAGAFGFACVNGFLNEKRSGALELLLVTPIPVHKLIFGRAFGLWRRFAPGAAVLAMGLVYLDSSWDLATARWSDFLRPGNLTALFWGANFFLALPILATYSALRAPNIIGGGALTVVGLGLVVLTPLCMIDPEALILFRLDDIDWGSPVLWGAAIVCNLVFIRITYHLLRHSLSRRIYSF